MKFLFFTILIGFCSPSFAQNTSENPKDSLPHPYKKAMLLSALLPGAGQVYNSVKTTGRKNAYWKVPLIYAGLSGVGYLLFQNQKEVTSIKTEYAQREIGGTLNTKWSAYDNYALVSLYQQYAQLRDFSILGLGAVYAFQILDAAVEAHFLNFDVTENLSLNIQPYAIPFKSCGLQLQFNFR